MGNVGATQATETGRNAEAPATGETRMNSGRPKPAELAAAVF
jgi:hypothetical protein